MASSSRDELAAAPGRGPTKPMWPLQHVEQLRQFVDACLADEGRQRASRADRSSAPTGHRRILGVGPHAAELGQAGRPCRRSPPVPAGRRSRAPLRPSSSQIASIVSSDQRRGEHHQHATGNEIQRPGGEPAHAVSAGSHGRRSSSSDSACRAVCSPVSRSMNVMNSTTGNAVEACTAADPGPAASWRRSCKRNDQLVDVQLPRRASCSPSGASKTRSHRSALPRSPGCVHHADQAMNPARSLRRRMRISADICTHCP